MANIIGANIYINGAKHNSYPVPLFARSYDVSNVVAAGASYTIQVSYVFDDGTESELSVSQQKILDSRLILSLSETSLDSVYWVQTFKSSHWPELVTTKDYFAVYSTDHSPDPNIMGTYWGEMDDVYFNGFEERGKIFPEGETPCLLRVPTSVSGLESDTVFLYVHGMTTASDTEGFGQETNLFTTAGGAELHNCLWNEQVNPLGAPSGENHTGYCRVHRRDDGMYVARHLSNNMSGNVFSSISIGANPLDLTNRVAVGDDTMGMDLGGTAATHQLASFNYNSETYGVVTNVDTDGSRYITLVKTDEYYSPIKTIRRLAKTISCRNVNVFMENNILYINYKNGGGDNSYLDHPLQIFEYDLANLEEDILASELRTEVKKFMEVAKLPNDSTEIFIGYPQQTTGYEIAFAIDKFWNTLESNGILSKLNVIFPMVGGTAFSHKYNLLNPVIENNMPRVNWIGGWEHSPTGAKPNGIDAEGETRIRPSNYTGITNNVSFYTRDDTLSEGKVSQAEVGCYNGNDQQLIISSIRPTGNYYIANTGAAYQTTNTGKIKGFYVATKINASTGRLFKNGSLLTEFDATGQVPSDEIIIGSSGFGSGNSNRELTIFTYGNQPLTDQEAIDFTEAVQQLQTDLKREV